MKAILYGDSDEKSTQVAARLLRESGVDLKERDIGENVNPNNSIDDVLAGKCFRVCPTLVEVEDDGSGVHAVHGGFNAIRSLVEHLADKNYHGERGQLIELDDHRPGWRVAERVMCLDCGHEWVGVIHPRCRPVKLYCSECGLDRGIVMKWQDR